MPIKHLVCARSCSQQHISIDLLNLHNNPVRQILLLSPFQRETETLSDLPKVTQLMYGGVAIPAERVAEVCCQPVCNSRSLHQLHKEKKAKQLGSKGKYMIGYPAQTLLFWNLDEVLFAPVIHPEQLRKFILTTYPNQPSPSCKNINNKEQQILEKNQREKQRSTNRIHGPEKKEIIQRLERI